MAFGIHGEPDNFFVLRCFFIDNDIPNFGWDVFGRGEGGGNNLKALSK